MSIADIDEDGWLDIAIANNSGFDNGKATSYLTVIFGLGDGMLALPIVLATEYGWETADVDVADLDGDGLLDIAAANASNDSVSIFLNLGDRTFAPQIVVGVGGHMPRSIVAADFDGDGLADLATLDVESKTVSIVHSLGGGGFALQSTIPAGDVTPRFDPNLFFPYPGPFLEAADLDADGDVDIAVPAESSIEILVNNGRGAFGIAAEHPTGMAQGVYAIRAGDLDGDGDLDLASASIGQTKGLWVSLREDGTWASPVGYVTDNAGGVATVVNTSLDLADVDHDGDLDVAMGQEFHQRQSILRNNGDGSFARQEARPCYEGPWLVKWADMNADDWVDLVLTPIRFGRPILHVWLNDQAGGLLAPERIHNLAFSANGLEKVRAGDLDGDGDADALGIFAGRLKFVRNDEGELHIVAYETYMAPPARIADLRIVDLNADGLNDLVMCGGPHDVQGFVTQGEIHVAINQGDLEFALLEPLILMDADIRSMRTLDADSDGDLDVAVSTIGLFDGDFTPTDRDVHVALNDGDGVLSMGQSVHLTELTYNASTSVVAVADVDGDGDSDIVTTAANHYYTEGVLWVLLNDAGVFSIESEMSVGLDPRFLALADLDADGDIDLVVEHWSSLQADVDPYLSIYHNDGEGAFTLAEMHVDPSMKERGSVSVEDMNLDGHPDLVFVHEFGAAIVHINRGDGTFEAADRYAHMDYSQEAAVADFTLDGRPDILLINSLGNSDIESFGLLRNRSCAHACPADINADGELNILDFVAFQLLWQAGDDAADVNGDGVLSILDFVAFQLIFVDGCE